MSVRAILVLVTASLVTLFHSLILAHFVRKRVSDGGYDFDKHTVYKSKDFCTSQDAAINLNFSMSNYQDLNMP